MTVKDVKLSEEDYRRFKDFLSKKIGLHFGLKRRSDLAKGLYERLSANKRWKDLDGYYNFLRYSDGNKDELKKLISLLTVGETYFFRDKSHFKILDNYILPEIIKKKSKTKNLRIWSAGCSTGEEPYSIAILLRKLLTDIKEWNIFILATDVNEEALSLAREGIYRSWSFRDTDNRYKKEYFTEVKDGYKISEEIKGMVNFKYLNLIENVYPSLINNIVDLDLIVCRNVTIYFEPKATKQIVNKFFNSLVSGGYLLVGHVEHYESVYDKFKRIVLKDLIIYRKKESSKNESREIKEGLKFKVREEQDDIKMLKRAIPFRKKERRQSAASPETNKFNRGFSYFRDNKFEEAKEQFKEILKIDPNNVRARYIIGQILANQGDIDNAQKWCEEILIIDPLSLEAHFLLSILYRQKGLVEKAIKSLKKVLYIDCNFVLGYFQLANYYREMEKNKLAIKYFNNAKEILLKKSPNDVIEKTEYLTVEALLFSIELALDKLKK